MDDIKRKLLDDHLAMEKLLTELSDSLEGGATAVCEAWSHIDQHIRDHFETEERCLFPLVADSHRADVEQLRSQHRDIRCALSELGVAADLHLLRKPSVDQLIARIHEHAAQEEHSLYDWTQSNPAAHRSLLDMFRRRPASNPAG